MFIILSSIVHSLRNHTDWYYLSKLVSRCVRSDVLRASLSKSTRCGIHHLSFFLVSKFSPKNKCDQKTHPFPISLSSSQLKFSIPNSHSQQSCALIGSLRITYLEYVKQTCQVSRILFLTHCLIILRHQKQIFNLLGKGRVMFN